MGIIETIPGLDPREPKTVYFGSAAFDRHRFALGQAATIGEQHTALEGMFLAAKVVTIGTEQFDMMPRRSSAHSRDIVPAIYEAGINHRFSWLTLLSSDEQGAIVRSSAPRLAAISLPREHAKRNLQNIPSLSTTVVYEFEGNDLSHVRTADQCTPRRFSYSPGHPVEGTVFAALGDYIRRRIESQLVVTRGKAYFGKPDVLPAPVPYAEYEMAGIAKA
mgnify:CR=1 FL=1